MYRPLKQKIVSVLVDNQANVLTRVISMFGRRGFNIDSLTVSTTSNPKYSRITIVFSATEQSMQQIITQTQKLEVVKDVTILTRENALYRELLLIRVLTKDREERRAVKEIVDIYRGKIVDLSQGSLIVEMTGAPQKINGFLDVMQEFETKDLCRTGVTGIEGINETHRWYDDGEDPEAYDFDEEY